MTAWRRRILGGAAVVVLLIVAGMAAIGYQQGRVAVQLGRVGRGDLSAVVSASGEVRPKRFVNISANVSGRIEQLQVQEGDAVKKGQILARIDATRFAADSQQAEAAVAASRADATRARADLELSRQAFERTSRMYADRLISEQAYEQAEAELRMKQANVEASARRIEQLRAALVSTADNLEKTTVVAPMDGVITSLAKEAGEMVIGAQSFQPTVIMTVADLSVMEAEVLVDETDVGGLALGQPATVRVDALDRLTLEGEVTEIGSSAIPRGTSGTTTAATASSGGNQAKDFKVTVTLKNPPKGLRPGLNATADVTTATRKGVLAVPIQAVVVREVDEEGEPIDPLQPGEDPAQSAPRGKGEERDGLFIVEDGKAHFRGVKTGILGETEVEIVEGVAEGTPIVVGSYKTLRTLKDGARVREDKKGTR